MKKILFVQGTEKISGGEKVSLDIATSLKKNFEFTFFLPQRPDESVTNFYKEFQIFYPNKKGFINSVKELKGIINKEKPDLIHAQGTRAAIFVKSAFVLMVKKFKFIYTLHGIHFINKPFPLNFLSIIYERLTNNFVDALVCVGKDDFNLARRLNLIKSNRLFLINNGIFIKAKKVGETVNKKIIVTVCRLHYQKDVGSLIKAMDLLRNEKVKLLVVGDGPERSDLENLAKNLGLGGKVSFLGNREDVDSILSIADVFVLSTNWEGQPLVILEAWANKRPVIASNVHGIKDLIENGHTGLLFRHNDPADLAEKIKYLLRNEKIGSTMGENGYGLVVSKYTIEIMSENYRKLYFEILND